MLIAFSGGSLPEGTWRVKDDGGWPLVLLEHNTTFAPLTVDMLATSPSGYSWACTVPNVGGGGQSSNVPDSSDVPPDPPDPPESEVPDSSEVPSSGDIPEAPSLPVCDAPATPHIIIYSADFASMYGLLGDVGAPCPIAEVEGMGGQLAVESTDGNYTTTFPWAELSNWILGQDYAIVCHFDDGGPSTVMPESSDVPPEPLDPADDPNVNPEDNAKFPPVGNPVEWVIAGDTDSGYLARWVYGDYDGWVAEFLSNHGVVMLGYRDFFTAAEIVAGVNSAGHLLAAGNFWKAA